LTLEVPLSKTFTHADIKSAKKYSRTVSLFALLGFAPIKVLHKILVKSTPTLVKAARKMLVKLTSEVFKINQLERTPALELG